MARSQTAASGQTTPTPDGSGPELETSKAKPTFDWATLDAPAVMPNKTTIGGIKVNVLETVPEPIRQRAEQSLTINAERVKAAAKSTAKRARVDYHWQLQPVPGKDTGEQFIKLLTKYAKYRPSEGDIPHAGPSSPKGQVTARCGDVKHYAKLGDDEYIMVGETHAGAFLGVRYSVRPHEQRGDKARLPGTA